MGPHEHGAGSVTLAENVRCCRVYGAEVASAPGRRFLVDRVWPRGVRRADLGLDGWLRDLAPSAELRTWFGHRPDRWDEFQLRYREELRHRGRRAQLEALRGIARQGPVTLLYGARDPDRNQAVVLRSVLVEAAQEAGAAEPAP